MFATKIFILACLAAVVFSQCPATVPQNIVDCQQRVAQNPANPTVFCDSCASALRQYFTDCSIPAQARDTLNRLCPNSGSPSTYSFPIALVLIVPAALAALF